MGVHVHNVGLQGTRFLVIYRGVGNDNHQIPRVHQPGRRAVHLNGAAVAFPGDGIGRQTLSVIHIHHVYALAGQYIGSLQQFLVDGDGSDIVDIGIGNGGAVDFPAHHSSHPHVSPIPKLY